VFNPIVRDGDKVLGGQGAHEPVRLGADGAFRVELRAANDAPLAARTVDAGELAGRIVFGKSDVLGATLEVRIPAGDDALRRAGWRVLLRSSDGTNVHELVGSGSDAAVFTPVVTVLEPASDDRQRPVGEPIVLGIQDKYQVHVYRSGDDTSAGNGRYYYPFEEGLLPAALLDASPLDVSEYGNKRFGSD
jgi:hypothetical protein